MITIQSSKAIGLIGETHGRATTLLVLKALGCIFGAICKDFVAPTQLGFRATGQLLADRTMHWSGIFII